MYDWQDPAHTAKGKTAKYVGLRTTQPVARANKYRCRVCDHEARLTDTHSPKYCPNCDSLAFHRVK